MTDPTWISLLPPLLAILLAIISRQVYLSLFAGIWLAWTILRGWNPVAGLGAGIEGVVLVLGDAGNARVILFTLVIGALIGTIETYGGVKGFVQWLEQRKWVDSPRKAQASGLPHRVDHLHRVQHHRPGGGLGGKTPLRSLPLAREKLAYLIDSTSAPICILIPLNAWGAYNLGILQELGVEDPLGVLLGSIPLNFYALFAVLLSGAVMVWGIDIGPMKKAEERARSGEVLWPDAQPLMDEKVLSSGGPDRIPPGPSTCFSPSR
jgi:tetracycline resistance efflux pump